MDEDPRYIEPELPYSLEAEQHLLGACMVHNATLDHVVDYLLPEHFANRLHGDIYNQMVDDFTNNKSFTPITLKPKIDNHQDLPEGMSAGQYLSRLAVNSVPPVVAKEYGKSILDYALRRKVIDTAQYGLHKAFDLSEGSADEIVEDIQHKLSGLSGAGGSGQDLLEIGYGMDKALELVDQAMADDRPVTGVPTGIPSLDRATGGWKPGNLITVAGRPGMGKTALAMVLAEGAASANVDVAVFSIEMAGDELALRIASSLMAEEPNSFTYFDASNGNLTDSQRYALGVGADRVKKLPIYISDNGGNTVESVRMETRRRNRLLAPLGRKIGLIVIDYLQLMHCGSAYKGNRVQEISNITGGLKRLAKELEIPIIDLSQLNRGVEARENKRPLMSDLRDSGSIEQDSDTIILLYRHWYYLKDQEPKKLSDQIDWKAELDAFKNKLEIIIGKQRRGPTKTLHVECKIETNTIRDFSR